MARVSGGNGPAADARQLAAVSIRAAPDPLGLCMGSAAFLASLTPSMIPRDGWLQGVAAGTSFAVCYGVCAGLIYLLRFLGLMPVNPSGAQLLRRLAWLMSAGLILAGLLNAAEWQNSIRQPMGMPPVETVQPLVVAVCAALVAAVLILIGRLFQRTAATISRQLQRFLPARAAFTAGFLIAGAIFWTLGSGVLVRGLVDGLDRTYAAIDAVMPADSPPPSEPSKTGGPGSVLAWDALGAAGREFIGAEPDRAAIETLTGQPAKDPLRIYVGLNSGEDDADRAGLALAEMLRTGAFDRSTLVIATPTGTGWIDPAASQSLEYLLRGDVATVAVQYSYLPSWLSMLVEPERGAGSAEAVFRAVYRHWTSLPRDRRPRLYLFGLSLGALNSDLSADLYDVLADPFDGAFWVGPPFASPTWNRVKVSRDGTSPVWAPKVRDGRTFRFFGHRGTPGEGYGPWGPVRFIYLQYPSDPIVFFETKAGFHAPAIFGAPRSGDLSTRLKWIPVVSFLQMIVDMMTATGTPAGHGHVYATGDYLQGWITLVGQNGWTEQALDRLRTQLEAAE